MLQIFLNFSTNFLETYALFTKNYIQENTYDNKTMACKRNKTKTHTHITACDMTNKAHNNVLMPIIYSVSVGCYLQRPLLALICFYIYPAMNIYLFL